ncbi:lipase [Rhizocola hellebori]|uniref:Lipase n=1 Tax=Rhizocola hellebori TaxID=1392758 RepID=A0A8J3VGA8_9ACTN|nr:lipase [Rhizocola hellebori]GIH06159.1 lipase [Rhizocola hellebori]
MWWGGLSPRRRALLTGVAVLAMASVVGGGLAWYHGERSLTPPPQDRLGPVVLVPGYGGTAGSLDVLAARIRGTGRQVNVVMLPDGGTGDLNRQAAALEDQVRQALRDGAPSVDVIGYSAGGVVARLWVRDHDGAGKARRVITLGSPHHGASIAAAGAAVPGACPTACQQLAPGSRLMAELSAPVAVPPVWLSVWTNDDQTVTPPESARLDGAVNVAVQSLCPALRLGHADLPTDTFVMGLVVAAIGVQPLSVPAAGGCVSS